MRRAVKVSLAFATQEKTRQINALMEAYRAAVNFYIRSLWNDRGKLDKATLARPIFNGSAVLDAKFVSVEEGEGSFDLAVRLSTLNKGKRITILTKKTAVFNKWNGWPASRLIQGCALSEDSLILGFEIPESIKADGSVLGVDIGVHKLISDSNGDHYGREFKKVRDKIRRRKPGSKEQNESV